MMMATPGRPATGGYSNYNHQTPQIPHVPHPIANSFGQLNIRSNQFQFNVDAPIFKPRFTATPNQDFAGQNNFFQTDPAFPATDISNPPHFVPPVGYGFSGAELSGQNLVRFHEVQVGMEQLLNDLDNFELWSKAIAERLLPVNGELMHQFLDSTFTLALTNPHSAYLIVRLLAFLSEGISDFMKSYLLQHCRAHHDARFNNINDQPEMARNFALFLAELYMQLRSSEGTRLTVLSKAVFEEIDTIIDVSKLHPERTDYVSNLHCCVQILKLCGRILAQDDKIHFDLVLADVNKLASGRPDIPANVRAAMANLRHYAPLTGNKADEGGKTSSKGGESSNSDSKDFDNQFDKNGDDGLIIGPDGKPLSKEEIQFMEDSLENDPYYQEDQKEREAAEKMRDADFDEMAEAYEEFLSTQNQNKTDGLPTK